ncbi:nucleoid-associated protein, partial [Pseudomonas aeruginosa]|uniref:nucleoid-associated protein n=1 Tax=Pseudomonas aeruginosa TaxID=287 RepID=UPI001EFD2FF9
EVTPSRHLDLGQLHLAARINISEWRNNKQSMQYISFIKGKGGRKLSDYFRDFIGCQEGVDSPGETRTLLKAFSDFVESEGMAEQQAREKTEKPMTLDALSELMDDQQPRAFYDYIRNKDYGLSPEIPADKRTLNQFRRFTGRAEGLSISFEAHLLGSRIEYDEERDTLQISSLPTQLRDLDGDVVNLFRVARDHGEKLRQALTLTPFARDEFEASYVETTDPLERARRLVIRSLQGFG